MSGHAVLAPSHAATWMGCLGSIAHCADIPDTESGGVYADEGTAAHSVASAVLMNDGVALKLAGEVLRKFYQSDEDFADALEYVDVYVQAVQNALTTGKDRTLLVEQNLSMEKWTSEKAGRGTSDAIIIDLDIMELEVWDLKFGQGHVVYAAGNKQLRLYGLGALALVESIYGKFKTIKMKICQPRRDHMSEETLTREELMAFGEEARRAGEIALSLLKAVQEKRPAAVEKYLTPSAEACLWCKGANTCKAREKMVHDAVFEEFTVVEGNNPTIRIVPKPIEGDIPSEEILDLIADWVKAKREWIEGRVRGGHPTPGWKMVLGKKGNRKFTDLAEVERLLKSLKFKKEQMYDVELIPLTKIEKLVPKAKWKVFEDLIKQAPARPIVVSDKDGRPEYSTDSTADNFENVEVEKKYEAFV